MLEDSPIRHASSYDGKWDRFPCSHDLIKFLIKACLGSHFKAINSSRGCNTRDSSLPNLTVRNRSERGVYERFW